MKTFEYDILSFPMTRKTSLADMQAIYRAQNLERVVETGNCHCATRLASWDAAVAVFRERHASAERWEMLQASDAYNRRATAARPAAKAICDAAGNW